MLDEAIRQARAGREQSGAARARMACRSLRAIPRSLAASLRSLIEQPAFAQRTAHYMVERFTPVLKLIRAE